LASLFNGRDNTIHLFFAHKAMFAAVGLKPATPIIGFLTLRSRRALSAT
jgi:hypothetical protein